jgi:hypothetical protein
MNKIQGAFFRAIANISRTWKRNPQSLFCDLHSFLSHRHELTVHPEPSLWYISISQVGCTLGSSQGSYTGWPVLVKNCSSTFCSWPLSTYPCWSNSNKHFQEFWPIYSDERHTGLSCSCFRKKRFASPGWTSEHGSLQQKRHTWLSRQTNVT